MSDVNSEQQLLTAFFDGELRGNERARAEQLLQENPAYAELIQLWEKQRESIRALPRYKLSELTSENLSANMLASVSAENTNNPIVNRDSGSEIDASSKIGFAAIASLAAMLLLTLFVFPNFVDHQPVAKNEAVSSEPATDSQRPKPVSAAATAAPSRSPSALAARELGQVFSIDMQNFDGEPLTELNAVLAKNKIGILNGRADRIDARLTRQTNSGIEFVYVICTADQMKQAIKELSSQSNVDAFQVPQGQSKFDSELSPAIPKASAKQLLPVEISQKSEPTDDSPVDEIAMLDDWFRLVSLDPANELIQYLLVVRTNASD